MKEEVARIRKEGITDDELQRAKQGLLQAQIVDFSNDTKLASTLESTNHNGRTMAYYSDYASKIEAVTADDVKQVLNKYVDFERIYVVTAGDFAKLKNSSEK